MSDQVGHLSHANSHCSERMNRYSGTSGSSILASSIKAPSSASTISLPELSPCVTPVSLSASVKHGTSYEELEEQSLQEPRVIPSMHSRPATPLDTSLRTLPPTTSISISQQPTQSLSPKSIYSHHYLPSPLDLDIILYNSTFHRLPTISTIDVRSEYDPRRDTRNKSKLKHTLRSQGISYCKPPKSWQSDKQYGE